MFIASSITSMTQQKLRVILLSIFLSLPLRNDCLSIRARRSNPDDRVTDQDVIDAINVLQRAGLARSDPVESEGRMVPARLLDQLIDSSMALGEEQPMLISDDSEDNNDNDYNDDVMQMSPVIAGMSSERGLGNEEEDEDDEKDEEKEKRVLDKRPVDKVELQGLFKPTPEVIVEAEAVAAKAEKAEDTPGEKGKIVRSEIIKLLSDNQSEAKAGSPYGAVEVDKVETEETKPGSDGVVRKTQTTEWIFKPDIAGGMDFYPNSEELSEGLANKEWLIDLARSDNSEPAFVGNGVSSSGIMKKKRSSEPPIESTPAADGEGTLRLKKDAVELLKAYIEQQEDENRHLARALNLATLSQVENTDQYLEEEIDEIKRAAKNERILETLREIIAMASQAGVSSDLRLKDLEPYIRKSLENEDVEDIKRKRDDPVRKTNPVGFARPPPLVPLIAEPGDEEIRNSDVIDDAIKNKLRELLIKAGEGEESEVPADSIISEYNRYRLNPFLRDIYEVESSPPAIALPYGDKYSEPDGVCEAVELLADDCLAARSRDLLLDSEATDLCDRHKLCYKCGSYFGMTPDTCDRGYMNEAAVACSVQKDSDTCHEDALGLYAVMIRQHIALSLTGYPAAPTECAAPCVYGYIVGADRRRRR